MTLPLRILASLLLLVSLSTAAWAAEPQTTYRLRVDGIACPFCSYGLEKKLKALDGAQIFSLDLKTGVTLLTLAPGRFVGPAQVHQAVKDAGFAAPYVGLLTTGTLIRREGDLLLELSDGTRFRVRKDASKKAGELVGKRVQLKAEVVRLGSGFVLDLETVEAAR